MRAHIALNMPVLVARDAAGIRGAAMGYTTVSPAWPTDIADEWDRFEKAIPGMTDRMAVYEAITAKGEPAAPHYYLGVIGVQPELHGLGIGTQLLKSFCDLSASDPLSSGVYLRRRMHQTSGSTSALNLSRPVAEALALQRCGACICRMGRDDAASAANARPCSSLKSSSGKITGLRPRFFTNGRR